jgi:hypothetical protein
MAIRKQLVISAGGEPEGLQPGDSVSGTSETGQVTLTAAVAMIAGQAVYTSGNDAVNKAQSNAAATADVLGLCVAAIGAAVAGVVQVNGIVTLSTAQWDAICGTTGGLTANQKYFLSAATAGLLTSVAPSTSGQLSVLVGRAISTVSMLVEPRSAIRI